MPRVTGELWTAGEHTCSQVARLKRTAGWEFRWLHQPVAHAKHTPTGSEPGPGAGRRQSSPLLPHTAGCPGPAPVAVSSSGVATSLDLLLPPPYA